MTTDVATEIITSSDVLQRQYRRLQYDRRYYRRELKKAESSGLLAAAIFYRRRLANTFTNIARLERLHGRMS